MNPISGKAIERTSDVDRDGAVAGAIPSEDDISLIALLNVVLSHRRLLVALPVALATMTLVAKLLEPRTYTATASFIPQQSEVRSGGGLANVAAQFGFRFPASRPSESPAFYAELLRSRAILGRLVDAEYSFSRDGESRRGTLIEIYRVDGDSEQERREKAIRRLERAVGANPSRQTDIVQLSVRATQPALAKQIAERALALVNEFNLEQRRSHAREERTFVADRLAQAGEELRRAERNLGEFLQRNREFRNSPDLSLRHDALQREVGMRQEVYTTLAQSYEEARIEEVRNIPVITILDAPEEPVRGNARGTVAAVLFAAIIGLVIALVVAVIREFFRATRQRQDPNYREFARIWDELLAGVRRPWRLWRRDRDGGTR